MARHSFTLMCPRDFIEISRLCALIFRLLTRDNPNSGPCIFNHIIAKDKVPVYVIFFQEKEGNEWRFSIFDSRTEGKPASTQVFHKEYEGHNDHTLMRRYEFAFNLLPYHLWAGKGDEVFMNGLDPEEFVGCIASRLAEMMAIADKRDFFVGIPKNFNRKYLDGCFYKRIAVELVPQSLQCSDASS